MEAYGTNAPGVSFRGAPDDVGDRARVLTGALPAEQLTKDAMQESLAMKQARNFFLIIGTLLVTLMVLIPCADAVILLQDPTFVFFVGRGWPERIIMLSACSVLLYFMAVVAFFGYARQDAKTDVSMFMIASIIVTTMGLAMVSISGPMKLDTEQAIGDLFYSCAFGSTTQGLYEHAAVLQGLRNQPGCRNLTSVTECDGYQEAMPYTRVLQVMEHHYKCAGFCYAAAAGAHATTTGLLQVVDDQPQQKEGALISALQHLVATRKLSGEAHAALLQVVGEEEKQVPPVVASKQSHLPSRNIDEPGRTTEYPPALFTNALYQTSCDGMAARNLQFQGLEVTRLLFWEGTCLLFSVILAGLLKLFTLCRQPPPRGAGELSRKLGVLYT